jgi:hypothetical protein
MPGRAVRTQTGQVAHRLVVHRDVPARIPRGEPLSHLGHLGGLDRDGALGEGLHLGAVGAFQENLGGGDGLLMVGDQLSQIVGFAENCLARVCGRRTRALGCPAESRIASSLVP